jgi:LysM repeat protein
MAKLAELFARPVKLIAKLIAMLGVPLLTAACSNAPQQQTSATYGETTGSIQRPVISRPATVYVQPAPRQVVYAPPPPQRVVYAPMQQQTELRRLRRIAAACETTASIPRTTRTAAYTPAYTTPAYTPRYTETTGSISAPSQYQTTAPAQPNAMWHVVAPGETLSTIARRYNVSVIEIARINELRNFPQIRSGSMILIPLT